jgi:predicted nucleic acid-binding protein
VAAFRNGSSPEAEHLSALLVQGVVLLPAAVRLELLAGSSRKDYPSLRRWLSALPRLVPPANVWPVMEQWVSRAAEEGTKFGVADLLVAASAADEGVFLWSLDSDFARMAAFGFVRMYRAT